ncbi:hypothetical protein GTQ43_09675 [Nostoc sp. KVJ3]|uniref:hypothetical protein n=1 Tax=Nostoc sp. KVJ3 TaxID=457945 RepID=UPI0022380AB5|nr:hypothetical protein [Nostoc sp. KVJ3]MCW5314062.1 hypothetical protein [Nostoc sp. KVJ3]
MVCYELRSNTTPVATTEGTSLRVHQSPTALDSPQRTGSPTIPNFIGGPNFAPPSDVNYAIAAFTESVDEGNSGRSITIRVMVLRSLVVITPQLQIP